MVGGLKKKKCQLAPSEGPKAFSLSDVRTALTASPVVFHSRYFHLRVFNSSTGSEEKGAPVGSC